MKSNDSWREYRLTIPAKSTKEVVFNDTMPNHYYINNLSTSSVFLSVQGIPTSDSYDLKVESFNSKIYGRSIGSSRVQIYNESANPALIVLTTFVDEFNPTILASTGSMSSSSSGGGTEFDGRVTIQSFNTSLPTGANKIGVVDIGTMPTLEANFTGAIPVGDNTIGRVKVTELPPLAEGTNKIGNVGIAGGVVVTSMPDITVSTTGSVNTHQYYSANVGTLETVWVLPQSVNNIAFISNDGDSDLLVAFGDTDISSNALSGVNANIRLLGGEKLSDIPRQCDIVRVKRESGSGNVRFMGV